MTFLANPKYRDQVNDDQRRCRHRRRSRIDLPMSQIISGNPYLYFAQGPAPPLPGETHTARHLGDGIGAPGCGHARRVPASTPMSTWGPVHRVFENCVIYPGCFIGDGASVGEHTVLHPNVVVYDGCTIGRHCIIHAGVVIGSDGFGFAWDGKRHVKVPQKGDRHHRRPRGDRQQLHHRPGRAHQHPDRFRREDGQPRPDRPQRRGGRPYHHRCPDRHLGQRPHRYRRGAGRPVRSGGAHHHR
ncbi:MAG: hypothetical protein MZU95_14135 [Desulfomicrobium escambiense]|nr:hypothetical protein [Desulfomicrobium escambiense]